MGMFSLNPYSIPGTVTFSFHDGSFEFALTSSDSVNVTDGRIHTLTLFRFSGQTQIALEVSCEIESFKSDESK